MIFPFRSDKNTVKIPNATIALIGINLIIWILTNRTVVNDEKQIDAIHQNLARVEYRYMYEAAERNPDILKIRDVFEFHKAFRELDVIPRDDENFVKWLKLYNKLRYAYNNSLFRRWGYIPAQLDLFKLLVSLFLHGSFFHVFGNMLYLWIVGCNIEDDWGWPKFLGLYFLSGIAAGFLHSLNTPNMTTPCIGASGAVAGVMGAFMIFHFKTKIQFAYFYILLFKPIYGTFKIWAGLVLPVWFLQEYIFAKSGLQTGTAHWAHVGGFVFAAILALVVRYVTGKTSEKEIKEDASVSGLSSEEGSASDFTEMTPIPFDLPAGSDGIVTLSEIIHKEPFNYPVRLCLARIQLKNGHPRDAAASFNFALDTLFDFGENRMILIVFREIKEHGLLKGLSGANLFRLAFLLEKNEEYQMAVKILDAYIKWHPRGAMRAKAIYRAHLILKDHIGDERLAIHALDLLMREYPDFSIQPADVQEQ